MAKQNPVPTVRGICLELDSLLDLCSLAQTGAEIVQLCTTDLAAANSFYLHNVGGMHGENLLTADTVAQTANGDGLLNAAMLASNDGSLECLHSFTSAFLDFYMHTNGVAHVHLGQFLLHVLAGQSLHQIHNSCPPCLLGVHTGLTKPQRTTHLQTWLC